ncbi:unnamed protein product [Spirodela intermedia]|uniref:Uncharacterized protein n=1 Tax=Spirodela intermedia TaxID=51605 RepID=A0A7I8JEF4_SPIIN|nr:unnamed protein product [Spirodela intermedia]CAA6667903.1 unnamed protein product [Spirodela intermedia]
MHSDGYPVKKKEMTLLALVPIAAPSQDRVEALVFVLLTTTKLRTLYTP